MRPPFVLFTSVAYHFTESISFSGAHISPAVTLGVTLAGGLKPVMAIPYVLSQLVGAIIGAGIVRVCHLQFYVGLLFKIF